MKNLVLICMFCILNYVARAQDITISFNAKSDTVAIDSIHVLNLRTNQKVKLSGGQNLILVNTSTNLDILPSVNGNLMVYPNPTREYANLTFSLPASQNVVINVYNISGQLLLREIYRLHSGKHQFKVNFPVYGLYHVSVSADNSLFNSKVLYLGDQTGSTDIKYTGSELYNITKSQLKSTSIGDENNTIEFKPGDVIHYTFYSGENITLISDTPTESTTIGIEFFKCTDTDGKNYKTVQIGDQVWMAENLAYIPWVNPSSQGSTTTPYYYVYDYDGSDVAIAKATDNYMTYGVLYNWPAAMAGETSSNANPSNVNGVCPVGWHLPSDEEWTHLENYLVDNGNNYGGVNFGGGSILTIGKLMAATTNWDTSSTIHISIGKNPSANNKSGFSGLPGGLRWGDDGMFYDIGKHAIWWSCEAGESSDAWIRGLYYNFASVGRSNLGKANGFSVRCVKD